MAQLRRDFGEFDQRDTTIVVVGPENAAAFASYFGEHDLPFVGLPDPKHSVLKLYGQKVSLFKMGRMPAQVLVDKAGVARFVHYGHDMKDIPESAEMLALIDDLAMSDAPAGAAAPPGPAGIAGRDRPAGKDGL